MVGIYTHEASSSCMRSETELELFADGTFSFQQTILRFGRNGRPASRATTKSHASVDNDGKDMGGWSLREQLAPKIAGCGHGPAVDSCLLLNGNFSTQQFRPGTKGAEPLGAPERRQQVKEYPTFSAFRKRPKGEAWRSASGLRLGYGPGFAAKPVDKFATAIRSGAAFDPLEVRTKMLEQATDLQLAMLCCNNAESLGPNGERDADGLKKLLRSGNQALLHALGISVDEPRSVAIDREAAKMTRKKMVDTQKRASGWRASGPLGRQQRLIAESKASRDGVGGSPRRGIAGGTAFGSKGRGSAADRGSPRCENLLAHLVDRPAGDGNVARAQHVRAARAVPPSTDGAAFAGSDGVVWRTATAPGGAVYYYDARTGTSSWTLPVGARRVPAESARMTTRARR
jgi:hypothetical protein